MTTGQWIGLGMIAWGVLMVLVVSWLTAAKRRDEQSGRGELLRTTHGRHLRVVRERGEHPTPPRDNPCVR